MVCSVFFNTRTNACRKVRVKWLVNVYLTALAVVYIESDHGAKEDWKIPHNRNGRMGTCPGASLGRLDQVVAVTAWNGLYRLRR